MAASFYNTYVLNANMDRVCGVVRDVGFWNTLKFRLQSEMPMQNGMKYFFKSGTTFTSWGETVEITVTYLNESATQVSIRSECSMPTQIIDWGKNKENVEKIYYQLSSACAYPQNYAPAPQQPSVRKKFCVNCGHQLAADARFCSSCGTAQEDIPE